MFRWLLRHLPIRYHRSRTVTAARHGSFLRAAEELNAVNHQTVLEQQLGLRMFRRRFNRSVRPTEKDRPACRNSAMPLGSSKA
jgi:hypothetical protein